MGNCLGTCFGKAKKKTNYFTGRYKNYDVGIEFENLIEDESNPNSDISVLTELERQHLLTKRFTDLERDQRNRDAEIDAELLRQEDNLRIEEESYNEAKREAARAAKQAMLQEDKKKRGKDLKANGSAKSSWLGDDEDWDVAGGEDDFEMFLDSVKARSQAIRANGFTGPAGVSSSKPYQKEEKVVDLKPSSTATLSTPQAEVKGHESDLEWDSDFVSAETDESEIQMQGGKSFGGTESESVIRTSRDKNAKPEHAGNTAKSVIRTDDEKTSLLKHSGIKAKPSVQSISSISAVSATSLAPQQKQTTTAASKHSNLGPEKRPLINKDVITRTSEIDTGSAKVDAIIKDKRTTVAIIEAESEDDLDEFDIDKFLEELDFDT